MSLTPLPIPQLGLDALEELGALDYSTTHLRHAGQYLKNCSRANVDRLHASGLSVWLISERQAGDALRGAEAGREFAKRDAEAMTQLGAPQWTALYGAVDLGVGEGTDLDRDGQPDLPEIYDYFYARDEVLRGAGFRNAAYGDGDVLRSLSIGGLELCWLAGALGWSGSRALLRDPMLRAKLALIQGPTLTRGGQWPTGEMLADLGLPAPIGWPALPLQGGYDPNLVLVEDFGQWRTGT